MKTIIYKGTDKTLPFTLTDDVDAPISFEDVTVSVELNVKDRVVALYSSTDGTVLAGASANECKILLLSSVSIGLPTGMLRAVVTVGFPDTDYPDGKRDEIIAVNVYEVKEAK